MVLSVAWMAAVPWITAAGEAAAPATEPAPVQTFSDRVRQAIGEENAQASMDAMEAEIRAKVPPEAIERIQRKSVDMDLRRQKFNEELESVDSNEYPFIFMGLPAVPGADYSQNPERFYDPSKSERANRLRVEWTNMMQESQGVFKELDAYMAADKEKGKIPSAAKP